MIAMRRYHIGLALIAALAAMPSLQASEIVIYSFEGSLEGWVVPEWARGSADYVVKEMTVSTDYAEDGHSSLKFWAEFPGDRWTGAYAERLVDVKDWTPFGRLLVGVYLPAGAPSGLRGKIILTVGDTWTWTEMNKTVALTPGAWTTIAVNLKPGSMDWKFFPDEAFRKSVDTIGVRIEAEQGTSYSGSVFLDHIRLAE